MLLAYTRNKCGCGYGSQYSEGTEKRLAIHMLDSNKYAANPTARVCTNARNKAVVSRSHCSTAEWYGARVPPPLPTVLRCAGGNREQPIITSEDRPTSTHAAGRPPGVVAVGICSCRDVDFDVRHPLFDLSRLPLANGSLQHTKPPRMGPRTCRARAALRCLHHLSAFSVATDPA